VRGEKMATEKRLFDINAMFPKESCVEQLRRITNAPTVDAVPMDDMKEFAADVAYQYGYYGQYNGRLHIGHGGLSTLEWAFDILGWDNPHPVPEFECEIDGCHEHATCGAPTSDGYKRMCGKHFAERGTNV
jgi:hypothetical protein